MFYDPLGRAVGTLHPDHTWEKVVFTPWKQRAYDRNDTVRLYTTLNEEDEEITDPRLDPDVGNYFERLPEDTFLDAWYDVFINGTTAQQDAATKASAHNDTPSTTWFDALGRAFLSAADDGTDLLFTRTVLDIEGNALRVIDARGVVVMTTAYDVAGRPMRTTSPDAGERVMFADVAGKPLLTWDSRDQRFRIEYDEVRRPVGTYLSVSAGAEKLVTQMIFGDSDHADAPANPAILNHRGRVYIQRDGSGETMFDAYDFKGNLWNSTRQLADDFKNVLDWSETVTLEAESFETETEYDALNRVTSHTTPDASETLPTYNEAGLLESVDVKLRGASSATPFVTNIDYNARGQRTKIEYGNGTVTEYEYDAATFRLTHLTTTRTSPAATLQNLTYTYDPVGNVTRIVDDDETQANFFSGGFTDGTSDHTYDPLYRLVAATGREHTGQLPRPEDFDLGNIPHPNDTDALVRYTHEYGYDAAGNIVQMKNTQTGHQWTQDYEYATDSNRLASTTIGQDTLEYDHDAHGNMALPHLTVQTWDAFDRLQKTSTQSVQSGTPETTYYVYDASGQRVRKVTENYAAGSDTPTRKNERIYLGGFEIWREYDAGELDLERESLHVMDDAARVALVETKTIDGGDPVTTPTSLQRYQLGNHLGSACVEVDDDGAIISFEEYYPFGGTSFHSATTAIPKRYRYTGKERDDETGLYYYGARYYVPWLARWTAADPAGFVDGPNVYAYVRNNPVMMVDPKGTQGSGAYLINNKEDEDPKLNQTETFDESTTLGQILSDMKMKSFLGSGSILERLENRRQSFEPVEEMRGITAKEYDEGSNREFQMRQTAKMDQERNLKTYENIRGGAFGAAAYGVSLLLTEDPMKQYLASEMGAGFDQFAVGAAVTRSMRQPSIRQQKQVNLPETFVEGTVAKGDQRVLGRGSTAKPEEGTSVPRNLREQLAANSVAGEPFKGTRVPVTMKDLRWPASEGWQKRQQVLEPGGESINIHYVFNRNTGQIDDIKIVYRGMKGK